MSSLASTAPKKVISVIQGEYSVSGEDGAAMSTVLGSCIAACLYDPVQRVGGMNHFLLPEARSGDSQNVKYGAYLMELLINDLLKMGAQRHRLRVKLAGGGKMSQFLGDVGEKNIAFVNRYLANEGLPVEWSSLGGTQARRIHFYPTTGQLLEKFVRNDAQIDQAPATSRTRARPQRPDVELF
ncbi:MAG: chemotaxis protein CheD [Pseudomonadota bacterium]